MKRVQTVRPDEFSNPRRDRLICSVSKDAPSKTALFRRVFKGLASPRQAIKAQCLTCCWMDEAAISGCTAPECPLWDFRPYRATKGGGGDT
jgi:hypothetical protein